MVEVEVVSMSSSPGRGAPVLGEVALRPTQFFPGLIPVLEKLSSYYTCFKRRGLWNMGKFDDILSRPCLFFKILNLYHR